MPVKEVGAEYQVTFGIKDEFASLEKALHWFEKGARQNCPRSMAHFGRVLYGCGFKVAAFHCLCRSSRMHDPIAQYMIANDILETAGDEKIHYARYIFLLLSGSHRSGFLQATYLLGTLHESGFGTPVDLTKAYDCYLKATEIALPSAFRKVGFFLLHGYGIPKNTIQAETFLRKARNLGDQKADDLILAHFP